MTVRKPCGPGPGTSRRPLDGRLADVKSDLDEMMSLQENSIPLKRPRIQESSVLFNDK